MRRDQAHVACQVHARVTDALLACIELRNVQQVVTVREQRRGITMDDREVAPLTFREVVSRVEHGVRGPENPRLISSVVPSVSSKPTNWYISSSTMRASFSRCVCRSSVAA